MQRLFVILLVGVAVAWLPTGTLAGNQEVAEQIAANLKSSGQLEGYQVGVRYQNGTTWLFGQVATQAQMNTALKLVFQTAGVTRVVNELTIAPSGSPGAAVPVSHTAPISHTAETGSLRQAAGAMEPEQLARSTPREFGVTRSRQAEMAPPTTIERFRATSPSAVAQRDEPEPPPANRVATSFTPQPVQPVTATSSREPSLAPPQIDASQNWTSPQMVEAMPVAQTVVQPAPHTTLQPIPDGMVMGPAYMQSPGQPLPVAYTQGGPLPMSAAGMPRQHVAPLGQGPMQARYDQPHLPNRAWPSYAAYPNYAAVSYPKHYQPGCWPYIGPFYPYPQVPLSWRKVTLEWHDGCWQLDFDDGTTKGPFSGLFRPRH